MTSLKIENTPTFIPCSSYSALFFSIAVSPSDIVAVYQNGYRNNHLLNHPEKQAKADKFPKKKIMENQYHYLTDCSG